MTKQQLPTGPHRAPRRSLVRVLTKTVRGALCDLALIVVAVPLIVVTAAASVLVEDNL